MIDWTQVIHLRDRVGADRLGARLDMALLDIEQRLKAIDARPPRSARDLRMLRKVAATIGFSALCALCRRGEDQLGHFGHFDMGEAALKASFGHSRQMLLRDLPHVMGRDPWDTVDAVA
ncbi:hypothetical protein PANO111632_16935 [Paracoccus nototheniae]|uniref:Uncharacterized protein n=1 Tax=Paracoccus nototheniae TaxID=2489002 RepID=A0ABW4DUM7_9RHOB|nr:hypothetical protein [Paracoccus nototheniae]